MLTNFVGDIKQQMFYQFWKFKLDTLIIDYFIQLIWYGHPAQSSWSSVTFYNVIVIQSYSLYFNTLLGTQKSNTNLNNLLFMNMKFDELLSEISNVLQKRRVYLNHVSLNSSVFPILGQSPWSMAMCLVWQSLLLGNGWNWSLFFVRGSTVDWGGADF